MWEMILVAWGGVNEAPYFSHCHNTFIMLRRFSLPFVSHVVIRPVILAGLRVPYFGSSRLKVNGISF